jgi:hypothetical protein
MLDVDVWVDEQDDISDKTKANMKSCLHDFWSWLLARKVITADQFPSFPKTPFELGWRNITDIPTQQSIIEKVKDLSYHINPKKNGGGGGSRTRVRKHSILASTYMS